MTTIEDIYTILIEDNIILHRLINNDENMSENAKKSLIKKIDDFTYNKKISCKATNESAFMSFDEYKTRMDCGYLTQKNFESNYKKFVEHQKKRAILSLQCTRLAAYIFMLFQKLKVYPVNQNFIIKQPSSPDFDEIEPPMKNKRVDRYQVVPCIERYMNEIIYSTEDISYIENYFVSVCDVCSLHATEIECMIIMIKRMCLIYKNDVFGWLHEHHLGLVPAILIIMRKLYVSDMIRCDKWYAIKFNIPIDLIIDNEIAIILNIPLQINVDV